MMQGTFRDALESLVAQIKEDRAILAVILCGSLSHDVVWARSDIDLVLVTIDDKKIERESLALYAHGFNVHAMLIARADFRTMTEGAVRNSFIHSYLAKGTLLYTHDESIAALLATLGDIGARDTRVQLLRAGTEALPAVYKAHKFLVTRGDLDYTALWILHAATSLARIEVISARLLATREVIQQAMELHPAFFKAVYTDLLNTKKSMKNVKAALALVDDYLAERARTLFSPVIDHLREAGEVRSASEIENHFTRNFGIAGVTTTCEYLADTHLIGKASATILLTKKSNADVQELAFYYHDE